MLWRTIICGRRLTTGEFQDIFKIQSDISEHVAEALKVKLLSAEKKKLETAPTSNIDAYTIYMKGRCYWSGLWKVSRRLYNISRRLLRKIRTIQGGTQPLQIVT